MSHESIKKAPYPVGLIPDKPHVHNYHEFLCFIGSNPNDLTKLGAEAELSLGKRAGKAHHKYPDHSRDAEGISTLPPDDYETGKTLYFFSNSPVWCRKDNVLM